MYILKCIEVNVHCNYAHEICVWIPFFFLVCVFVGKPICTQNMHVCVCARVCVWVGVICMNIELFEVVRDVLLSSDTV